MIDASRRSAGAAATICSPTIGCWQISAHSAASNGPGLDKDRLRDRELAALAQRGRPDRVIELAAPDPKPASDRRVEALQRLDVLAQPGRRGRDRADEDVVQEIVTGEVTERVQPSNLPGWQPMRIALIPGGNTSDFEVYNLDVDPYNKGG
jgi:hypothetical protein